MTLNKQQLADLLAHALNALNDAQQALSELGDTKTQGTCHDVIARIPKCILESCDYRNNGTMTSADVLMNITHN